MQVKITMRYLTLVRMAIIKKKKQPINNKCWTGCGETGTLTPVLLPEESHGQRSLEGYSPWGCKSRTRLSY